MMKYGIVNIIFAVGVFFVVFTLLHLRSSNTTRYRNSTSLNDASHSLLSLKGTSSTLVADARAGRQLVDYNDAYWPKYNGKACRTSSGDDGEHRKEYFHYEYKSLSWCKEKCFKTEECKAFEYKVEGDYRKCEIWFQEPRRFLNKEGYRCWIKGGDDDNNGESDSEEEESGEDKVTYTRIQNHVCRTHDGASGSRESDYTKYTYKTFMWCVENCDSQLECKGFEYQSIDTPHCKIWKEEPMQFETSNGSNCYVKNGETEPEPVQSIQYKEMENTACRTAKWESGSLGKEYEKYTQKSLQWCTEKCSNQESCLGYEYSSIGIAHCEIWNEEPKNFKTTSGMSCYVKL